MRIFELRHVQVDEAGTEAAAATAAICCSTLFCAAPRPQPPPIPFVADQPFLWVLCGPDGGGGVSVPLFTGLFGGEGGDKSSSAHTQHINTTGV
jgi:serine protease inhibitor